MTGSLRFLLALALALAALPIVAQATPAFAQSDDDPDTIVRAIEVDGLSRIDRQAVRTRIYTQIGRSLDRSRLSEDVKRLYAMGFFEDIQVAEKAHPDGGLILLFRLWERPTLKNADKARNFDRAKNLEKAFRN